MAIVAPTLVRDYVPGWLGAISPVVDRAEILTHKEVGGSTTFSARAFKWGECSWRRTEWHLGKLGGGDVPVFVKHHDKPQIREADRMLYWDAIEVGLTFKQIKENSFAFVYHACPGWPVLFKSRFY